VKHVFFILLFAATAGSGCSRIYDEKAETPERPKNIILMIGDGLGVSQLTAAKYIKGDIALEKFTAAGLITTLLLHRSIPQGCAVPLQSFHLQANRW
jgi:alkaline phosphatase